MKPKPFFSSKNLTFPVGTSHQLSSLRSGTASIPADILTGEREPPPSAESPGAIPADPNW